MPESSLIKPAPWDTAAFGMPAWEITAYSSEALRNADRHAGHQAIKVDPLADKGLLQRHGFYYCDTLLATQGDAARLAALHAPAHLSISTAVDHDAALAICHGAFEHGRFHRDFNLPRAGADRRYDHWLKQLLDAGQVYGLYSNAVLGGFIGIADNSLVLHAVAKPFRGQGLAKFWWHQVISALFGAGHPIVTSSISASNVAVMNLYASLGFSFQRPLDVYHRVVQ